MRYRGLLRRRESKGGSLLLARWLSASLSFVILIFGTHAPGLFTSQAAGPPPCLTVSATNPVWQSLAFVSTQGGAFTADIDARPLGTGIDAGVGLSNGPQTSFTGLACIARFNTSGNIDARNGGAYAAASTIPYSANTSYHFRFVVNVASHTYSVYVTPSGGSEQAVGVNYAFRTEQAGVSSLNYWSLFADAGSMQGCGFGAPCYTATAGGGWLDTAFASQVNTFTAEWDATPSATNIDAAMALSNGAQTSFAGFACLVRFNTAGMIDARDGGIYHAANTITYAANTSYHFRLSVNVPSHTYSVYVTPTGGSEQTVALDYAFRTEQQSVTSLNNYGLIVDSATGSARLCNFAVGGGVLFQDSFTGSDGLITNEYAHWNSDGVNSPDWDMTSGSLFRQSNAAWTGSPDGPCDPDKFSSSCTDSNVFRLNTFRTFAGNVKVSLALKNNSDIHDSNCVPPDTCWHGVHIWLRHLSQYDLYYVSINRADNKVVIKRKVPCGTDNSGSYFVLGQVTHAWTVGTWQHFSATVQTNADGSVTLKVYDDDVNPNTPIAQGTDSGGTNQSWGTNCPSSGYYPTAQYPPITSAGSVGVRGDFDNFNFDNFTVTSF